MSKTKTEEVVPCPTWEAGIALWLRRRLSEAQASGDVQRAQQIYVIAVGFERVFWNGK